MMHQMMHSIRNPHVCTQVQQLVDSLMQFGVHSLQAWLQVQQLMARRGRRRTPTSMQKQMKVGCPLAKLPSSPCQMLDRTCLHS